MVLHHNREISRGTKVRAANGKYLSALEVFAHSLRYFRDQALRSVKKIVFQDFLAYCTQLLEC